MQADGNLAEVAIAFDRVRLLFRPAQGGQGIPARIAMIAITTRSSMRSKKAAWDWHRLVIGWQILSPRLAILQIKFPLYGDRWTDPLVTREPLSSLNSAVVPLQCHFGCLFGETSRSYQMTDTGRGAV
jgi:hypothetical protein